MQIIGLTGGTGAGKSCAADRFESHGIPVIDADRVGHELIAQGGDAEAAVLAEFGPEIVVCGTISRAKLGARVFSDPEALAALNRIMHPRIADRIAERCGELADAGHHVVIVDGAILGDGGALEPWLAGLILVSSPADDRVARLVAQRGWSREDAWERVRAQVDPESKRPLARWVIENDRELSHLYEQVDAVARDLLRDGRSSSDGTL